MTPKEKAIQIINRFKKIEIELRETYDDCVTMNIDDAKQCALIAVEEIIDAIDWHDYETPNKEFDFWQEVKTEIEKL